MSATQSARRSQGSSKRRIAVASLVLAVLLVTFFALRHSHRSAQAVQAPAAASTLAANWQSAIDLTPTSGPRRPVFPYSVIPGGVRDAQDLRTAVSADRVVAGHYSDFRLAQAHTIRLDRPAAMYVSYRMNNRVYWTRNRMLIPAGETLISDGENLARVRCGNRLSAIAAKPVAVTDPSREQLETPESVPPLLADLQPNEDAEELPTPAAVPPLPLLPPGPSGSGPGVPPPAFFPPILTPGVPPGTNTPNNPNPPPPTNPPPTNPPPTNPPPPPVATPEPASWQLLLAGMFFCVVIGAFVRK